MSEELRIDIKSMTLPELTALMKDWGEPGFRAGQLFSWLHEKRVQDWSEMTNLSAALRQKLAERCTLTQLTVLHRLVSSIDGTQKYLYRLADSNCIETVLMKYKHGNSLCISTQVGCRMGCNFCASTLGGLVRHLTPSEMLEQVYETVRQSGERVDSLVLMGIGEPLDNYDNVIRFLRLLTDPKGYNLGQRHISLSTWFRDYVYFPLGGSRVDSRAKHIRNLFVVWLLTGIWHGANWTLLAWGLFYFVLLVLEKYGHLGRGWPVWAKWLFTFLMVNFAWVLFRADSLAAAGQYLQAMFGLGAGGWDDLTALYLRENWTVLAASVLFAGPLAPRLRNWAAKKDSPLLDAGYAVLAAAVFLVSAAFLIKGTYNPFIYFNF